MNNLQCTDAAIDCPICGHEIGVEPHVAGRPYSHRQLQFISKLQAMGISSKVTARSLRTTHSAVSNLLGRMGRGERG